MSYGGMESKKSPPQQSAVSDFEATVKEVQRILGYRREADKNFGVEGAQKINASVKFMMEQLRGLIKTDDSPYIGQEKITEINKMLDILNYVLIFKPITDFVRDATKVILKLTYNWNQNTCKNPQIFTKISMNTRLLENQKTLEDTIAVLKRLCGKLRAESYTPPAFEVSRHYKRTLEE